MIAELAEVAQVVAEDRNGPLAEAFKVSATPTLLRVARDGGGRILVTDNRVDLDRSRVSAPTP